MGTTASLAFVPVCSLSVSCLLAYFLMIYLLLWLYQWVIRSVQNPPLKYVIWL